MVACIQSRKQNHVQTAAKDNKNQAVAEKKVQFCSCNSVVFVAANLKFRLRRRRKKNAAVYLSTCCGVSQLFGNAGQVSGQAIMTRPGHLYNHVQAVR